MTVQRRRARRGEGDRLREEILAAVGALLQETQDESAVSIRAIADRVGVTPPSIYRHFADKDALIDAVCAEVFQSMYAAVTPHLHDGQRPIERARALGIAYIEFGLANPEHYRLVFMRPDPGPHDLASMAGEPREAGPVSAVAIAGSEMFGLLLDTVDELIAAMPVGSCPERLTVATALWSLVHGITSLRIAKPGFEWPPFEAELDAMLAPLHALLDHQ